MWMLPCIISLLGIVVYAEDKTLTNNDFEEVQGQYQDYPYPPVDPEEEFKNAPIFRSSPPINLNTLNHYLYGGKLKYTSNFRILVVGGGTGSTTIWYASRFAKFDPKVEIIYLDFSKASMKIAQRRAELRNLKNIRFIHDSLFNIPKLNLGKFDYIDCYGVLHHLKSPGKGLEILKDSLTEDGGMMIMVYAKYGRTGVVYDAGFNVDGE